ncbi:MAG TPA: hypothetical protein PK406_15170, partial [Verrucomicrobiota bacterium]|nr:hypothetical protein [Verrucomicrobiota bacterium]
KSERGPVARGVAPATGHVGMIDSIEVHVQSLSAAGHSDAAVALKSLAEATATSAELSQQARIEALEQLDELARQAAVAPEHRSKVGVLSALFHGLATTLSAAGGTAEVWSTWGNVIKKFLGL